MFTLEPDQIKKLNKFHPKCQKKYLGAIGGGLEYIFIPTSLGTIAKVKCHCGEELDLTEYKDW